MVSAVVFGNSTTGTAPNGNVTHLTYGKMQFNGIISNLHVLGRIIMFTHYGKVR